MPDIQLAGRSGNPLLKTAPHIIFADTFNRADGLLNGQLTPVGGREWLRRSDGSAATMSPVIRGGCAGILTDTANTTLFALIDAGVADGIFEVDFISGEGNTANVLPFRVLTVNNCLMLTVTNGKWTLAKRVSGTLTNFAVSSILKTSGQRLRIELDGPSIRVYVNGALALDVLESDHATNTMFGIGGVAQATTTPATLWDNISFTIPGE